MAIQFDSSIDVDGYLKWGQSSGGQVQYMYRGDGGIFAKQTATSNSIYSGSSYFSVRNSSDTSNLLFVNNTGNVGIGTTTLTAPSYGNIPHLAVANDAGGTLQLRDSTSNTLAGDTLGRIQFVSSYVGGPFASANIRTIAASNASGGASGGGHMLFETSVGNTADLPLERMRITSLGNVGIGTNSTGTYKLTVNGSTNIGGNVEVSDGLGGDKTLTLNANIGHFSIGDIDGLGDQAFISGDSSSISISTNQITTLYCDSNNRVGIGTISPITSLTLGTGSSGISFQSSSTTINSGKIAVIKQVEVGNGNGHLAFETYQGGSGGGERMRILNDGNVGIGTDSPDAKLEVLGTTGVIIDSGSNSAAKLTLIGDASDYGGGGTIDIIGGAQDYMAYTLNLKRSPNTLEANNQYWMANAGWTWDGNIGGTRAQPYTSYAFKTQGSSQMVIYNNNVGIGVTTPSQKLHVNASALIANNLYVGTSNTLNSCTYPTQYSLVVGTSNTLGGISNGIIGVSNTIACTNEPWLNFGGNFIAGLNNEINNLYSHANAVFGQSNAVGAFDTPSNSVSGILVGGSTNSVNGNNSLAYGFSNFTDQYAEYSLTGGYDSNNFGFYGSVAIGAGATASAGNNQYAFGSGVTTPTFSGNAYGADQFVVGKYNEYTNSSFVPHRFAVGNGSSDASRDTPFCVIGGGTYTNGQVSINDSDGYAYTSIPYSVFHVNGRATSSYSSSFTFVSDERVKKNIVSYDKGLSEILQVQPKSYVFNGKANTIEGLESIGVLAQEIKEVFPETVGTANKRLNPEDEHETELYAVDISPVTYALINAVKELNAKIETLESRIQTLEGN